MSEPRRGDEGAMAVEVVLLVPVLLLVVLLIVAMGRYVSAEGDTAAAARDAVRAATLARDPAGALAAARSTATAALPAGLVCAPANLEGQFVPGGTVTVRLDCQVSWDQLGLIGLTGSAAVHGSASAPVDVYRRSDT